MNPPIMPSRLARLATAVFWRAAAGLAALLALSPSAAPAADYQVASLQAAYVYNFLLYTDWPRKTGRDLVLCLAGENPDSADLARLDGRLVKGRRIVVSRLPEGASSLHCDALFVAASRYAHLIDQVAKTPVLTFANVQLDAERSPIISLVVEGGRVTFDADLPALRRAELDLSARVLTLARRVHR